MRKTAIISAIAVAVMLVWAGEFRWNAKNTAMGDGGFSLALDAGSIFYNPALAGVFGGGVLSVGYGIPLAGIESSAKSGYLAYARPFGWHIGAGVLGNFEKISSYQMLRFGGILAYRFSLAGTLSVGVGVNYLQRHYELPPDDPLNRYNNPSGVSADIGLLWQRDKIAVGISAADINEPELALEPDAEGTKLPRRIAGGISYRISRYFIPEIGIVHRSFVVGEKSNPEYHFGFYGGLGSGMVFWRGGINPEAVNFGVGLRVNALFAGVDIDYAFGLPLEKSLRSAGETQHYFGITFYGKTVRRRKGDLLVEKMWIDGDKKVGGKIHIRAEIKNDGDLVMRSISCALAVGDETGEWKIIYPTRYIDSLAPGKSKSVEWNWKPRKPGKYTIRVAVDDDGQKVPDISGHIPETNEENNVLLETVDIRQADTLIVEPKFTTVTATHLTVKVEEEPVVPVVFFGPNSAELSPQDSVVIETIAGRLAKNPDAVATLRGYYDPSDGDIQPSEIGIRRAKAVKSLMISRYPLLADRVSISTTHDFTTPRLTSRYTQGDPRVAEENRRVEISVALKSKHRHKLGKGEAVSLLKKNDEFLLVIVGIKTPAELENAGLARADSVRREILRENPDLKSRVVAEERTGEKPGVLFEIDPDGIAVRPRERFPISEQWKNPQPARDIIYLKHTGFENVVRWEVIVESEDGEVTHKIAAGTGNLPDSVIWNWSLGENQFLAPGTNYRIKVHIATPDSSYNFVSTSKIKLLPRKKVEAIENMLLVEFNFDETKPVSHYLERRLFNFAELFVARADSGYVQEAEIQGHTDNIGSERRNLELSTQRAKREYDLMRKIIAYFAGVPTSQLDNWLTAHNCFLSYKGYADQKPYTLRGKLIGDNSTPYGRSINRRVTLEYHYHKGE